MPLSSSSKPAGLPVLIAGGGPVGLTLAALLAEHGVASLVIEADDGYCSGSRAICISRRSQEILGLIGADRQLVEKGLSWAGGRSYFRHDEVLHFRMPSEHTERFAPMVNIQQYYIEQYAHEAMQRRAGLCDVRWSTRVVEVRQGSDGVEAEVEAADGTRETLRAAWLVACDGGRSTVRDKLGLQLRGMQYEGRYVIVDIEQDTKREVERLAWFDPPSNPGSTILMHRQPDNVWRIDYQIRDDEDPAEAVKPENVLPRVQSHLDMIGETAPWKPLWISIYNAKCLTLDSYRHGRVLFAGDAAHLVPIFGVRGLNSGLDDAANLAWKLALVSQGHADDALLDSYSAERVHATRENLAYGAKSTEFMAPPNFGFTLMREAALRLAGEDERVRQLVNPRQSTPIRYVASPLNVAAQDDAFNGGACAGAGPGDIAPEAAVQTVDGAGYLTERFGRGFVALYFSDQRELPPLAQMATSVDIIRILRSGNADEQTLIDYLGQAWDRYDAQEGTLYLIRPDGYVLGRWRSPDWAEVAAALAPYQLQRALAATL
ncbi:FAD-dependent oxidoreductase [Noviherbaspirillum cavernae]|uniref:FAD-dependent oxidoreductase n=1 Tax=Noviherbaspirillum cavernae TaxID=2320862 RepID=A0A418X5T7_9BURK|nr:FAD-dependent oxidoreductase [Noviherbaspirillum cavernae]RJG07853.1 FAD-dependent oxidoreductase [Noviherbaspirillum cavernae]